MGHREAYNSEATIAINTPVQVAMCAAVGW